MRVPSRSSRTGSRREGAACLRLVVARSGFEEAMAALRKAALDQVDRQSEVSTALRAVTECLVTRRLASALDGL